jgi:hypothetical protein
MMFERNPWLRNRLDPTLPSANSMAEVWVDPLPYPSPAPLRLYDGPTWLIGSGGQNDDFRPLTYTFGGRGMGCRDKYATS